MSTSGASAWANCTADGYRSAGDLASAVVTTRSRLAGTVSRTCRSGRGDSDRLRTMIACGVGPVNGGSPASIS